MKTVTATGTAGDDETEVDGFRRQQLIQGKPDSSDRLGFVRRQLDKYITSLLVDHHLAERRGEDDLTFTAKRNPKVIVVLQPAKTREDRLYKRRYTGTPLRC